LEDYGLNKKKLFSLTRKTLERRINSFYHETNDGTITLEMLITLQVREELCKADFSYILRSLVQRIFLQTRSTKAMRRYYLYFIDYFGKKEWRLLSVKLFPAQTFIAEKLEHLYSQVINPSLEGLAES